MTLPSNPAARKALPITTGVLDYFPDALAAVAEVSKLGNDQHNPGQPLHWSKDKSTDHADCITRHLIDRGTLDSDGGRHSAKVAWRALALLQIEIENERAAEAPRWDTNPKPAADDGSPDDTNLYRHDDGALHPTEPPAGRSWESLPTTAYHPDLTALERVAIETGSEVVHDDRCPACLACAQRAMHTLRDAGPDFPAWH